MAGDTKLNLLGVLVDAVDYGAAVEAIIAAARRPRPFGVSALAVHGVMTGALNATHRYRLNHLELVVPDGQPVRWGLNLLHGAGLRDRVYGPNLMLRVCEQAAQEALPVFLYGSRPEVLAALEQRLRGRFPSLVVAGSRPSAFRRLDPDETRRVVEEVRGSGARLCFAGLGCPRQEVWAYEMRERLGMPVLAVGAAFDFHAGLLSQAPERLARLGLEWLYRLSREPRRLWRRYLLLNPLYLTLLAAQWLHLRRFDPERCTPPQHELRYG